MAAAFGLTLAHLGETTSAERMASAFAAYITGNVASNLIGRLLATAVVSHSSLSANFVAFAALNLAGAALAFMTIRAKASPPLRTADPMAAAASSWIDIFKRQDLLSAFGLGFIILFAFIGTFTYVNFELVAPPLSVGMMQLGLIYFVFLPSIFTTPLAGQLVAPLGTRKSLWATFALALAGLPLLGSETLSLVLLGMTLVAIGTFAAQAVATGYVSRTAKADRAAASGLYLASYFTGGLVGTALLGLLYDAYGWTDCLVGIGASLIAALVLTSKLQD